MVVADPMLVEYQMAEEQERQPRCIHCGHPLDTVFQTHIVDIVWTWNPEKKCYDKDDSGGDANAPTCGHCEARDWNFVDEKFISF